MKKLIYILLAIQLAGCASTKIQGPVRSLIFGNGGGFTGIQNVYQLKNNKQLCKLKMNGDMDTCYQIKLSNKQIEQIFTTADQLRKKYMGFKNPGNIYTYLNLSGDLNTIPEFTWGQNGFTPPVDVVTFYNQLNSLVSSL
jgi:hypothetical protein